MKVSTKLNAVSEDISGLLDEVQAAVKMAMDEKVAESGQLTAPHMMEIVMEKISSACNSLQTAMADAMKGDNEWARLEAAIVLDELDESARPVLKDLQAGLVKQPNKYIVRVSNKAVNDLLGTDNKVP